MPGKPKINVTQVWILQKVVPYDGTEILNVYLDPEEAKKEHTTLGSWHYDEKEDHYYTSGFSATDEPHGNYYLLTRHPILVTRKTKANDAPSADRQILSAVNNWTDEEFELAFGFPRPQEAP